MSMPIITRLTYLYPPHQQQSFARHFAPDATTPGSVLGFFVLFDLWPHKQHGTVSFTSNLLIADASGGTHRTPHQEASYTPETVDAMLNSQHTREGLAALCTVLGRAHADTAPSVRVPYTLCCMNQGMLAWETHPSPHRRPFVLFPDLEGTAHHKLVQHQAQMQALPTMVGAALTLCPIPAATSANTTLFSLSPPRSP